jgi:cyclophilin family peptidyl-prolyl cis-trans isomerase
MTNALPNKNGSQFFITTAPSPRLNNNKRTVFESVAGRMEVMIAIEIFNMDEFD